MAKARAGSATVDIKIRMKEPLRADVERSARRKGISMNAELVDRVGRAADRQSLFGDVMTLAFGPGLAGLLTMVGDVMLEAGRSQKYRSRGDEGHWLADPDSYDEAVAAGRTVLDEFRPVCAVDHPSPPSTGVRFAAAHIVNVVNRDAPYPFGERERVDLARALLGPDLLAQSKWLRDQAESDAAIMAAIRAKQTEETPK